jgi:hypothetical protein
VNRGFESVADRLDDTAERIDRLADDRLSGGGPRGKAGDVAHSTAHVIEDVAEYFRETDLRTMQSDLERRVRERPIQTLLLAASAGWVLGKIMK